MKLDSFKPNIIIILLLVKCFQKNKITESDNDNTCGLTLVIGFILWGIIALIRLCTRNND